MHAQGRAVWAQGWQHAQGCWLSWDPRRNRRGYGELCLDTWATHVLSCESSVPGVRGGGERSPRMWAEFPRGSKTRHGREQRHRTDVAWCDCFEAKLPKEEDLSFRCALEILTARDGLPWRKSPSPQTSPRAPSEASGDPQGPSRPPPHTSTAAAPPQRTSTAAHAQTHSQLQEAQVHVLLLLAGGRQVFPLHLLLGSTALRGAGGAAL